MKYDEFLRNVGKAGLTLCEFADLMKMNRISLSNYSKKAEVPSHLAVIATLMGILADNDINFAGSIDKIRITPKAPRVPKGTFYGSRRKKDPKVEV